MGYTRYTIEHKGKFYTVRGQGKCCVGAGFLRAVRISYEVVSKRVTRVWKWDSPDNSVEVTELY